jgi:hypothetical protein
VTATIELTDVSAFLNVRVGAAAVAGARVVRLSGANHYVFLSNEADVLSEMGACLVAFRRLGRLDCLPVP